MRFTFLKDEWILEYFKDDQLFWFMGKTKEECEWKFRVWVISQEKAA